MVNKRIDQIFGFVSNNVINTLTTKSGHRTDGWVSLAIFEIF